MKVSCTVTINLRDYTDPDRPTPLPSDLSTAAWATDEADPDWRIVLAGYSGMWTPPRGWSTTVIPASRGGYQNGARSLTECLWASPSCMGGGLFGGAR